MTVTCKKAVVSRLAMKGAAVWLEASEKVIRSRVPRCRIVMSRWAEQLYPLSAGVAGFVAGVTNASSVSSCTSWPAVTSWPFLRVCVVPPTAGP